ncbi:hypothetical protein V5799_017140 [Amblyomma americanum]|uniref:Fucosyltransferase n=1 Tax=Amblyomma americanum TaxID=6943 RepID=A0AAQ4F335_AMBAM
MTIFALIYTDFKLPKWTTWTSTRRLQKRVKILFWTKAFGAWNEVYNFTSSGLTPHDNCPVPCFLTNNRSLIRTVDAVVIHDRDADGNNLPKYRAPHQRWVYWNLESPAHSRPQQMKKLKKVFNWTYTYRRDSDVWHPYSFVARLTPERSSSPPFVTWTNRSKLVVWLVSNCRTPSGRMQFVKELKKHIPVDIYGTCGNLKCLRRLGCPASFGRTYYFYLALENSICPDYVTEKFYVNALQNEIVPVVFGNYSDLAPPGSYINALDFASPKHVATYLKAVAADPSRYQKYFAWRNTHGIVPSGITDHCALCKALYEARPENRKVYKNIVRWWHGNGSLCTSWKPVRAPDTVAPAGRTMSPGFAATLRPTGSTFQEEKSIGRNNKSEH